MKSKGAIRPRMDMNQSPAIIEESMHYLYKYIE